MKWLSFPPTFLLCTSALPPPWDLPRVTTGESIVSTAPLRHTVAATSEKKYSASSQKCSFLPVISEATESATSPRTSTPSLKRKAGSARARSRTAGIAAKSQPSHAFFVMSSTNAFIASGRMPSAAAISAMSFGSLMPALSHALFASSLLSLPSLSSSSSLPSPPLPPPPPPPPFPSPPPLPAPSSFPPPPTSAAPSLSASSAAAATILTLAPRAASPFRRPIPRLDSNLPSSPDAVARITEDGRSRR
mmetsp:Transcript_11632/g.46844  ORF Transcript_11632/g.46844 Transcript_11632/m.46844 type:complete len:248 (-) Transcript_11632:234-977(-)